ncbi:MAG: response regulator [Magnetospirillum sp.]|nr:response regulator [Magnetospirillum sp.]
MAKDITDEVADLLQGRAVLVIDDQRLSRHIVMRFFAGTACVEPLQAVDGGEGLQLLSEKGGSIGAVVCDFNMPGINGLQVLKAVRTEFGGIRNDLPVIMLTGNNDGRLVGAALALDVDAFIVKPVSKTTLMGRLRRVLSAQKTVKSPAECALVDVDAATETLNSLSVPVQSKAEAPIIPRGREVATEAVEVPATLAQDIRAPSGELLLVAGTTLTRRLVDRLVELNALGIPLATVWVL